MQNSVDRLQALLEHVRWGSGRLKRQCDELEAEFASLTQIAPEEAEARIPQVRAQLERALHNLISILH
jgi:hypothetical protein